MAGRRFQLHLSTIVLVTLAAGGLLGANFYRHQVEGMQGAACGFPFPAFQNWEPPAAPAGATRYAHYSYLRVGPAEFAYGQDGWSYPLVAINFVCCLLILIAFAVGCEWLARKTERKT